MPVLGFDTFKKAIDIAPPHVHAECLEISLCLRGDLEFELEGQSYPFRPDTVFVSRPNEVHRLRHYPRNMSKYWVDNICSVAPGCVARGVEPYRLAH